MKRFIATMPLAMIFVCCSALESWSTEYTTPEFSGLIGIRPFPTHADVCQVLGENSLTSVYMTKADLLIACPVHERGAIEDRLAEGAVRLGQVGSWVLLSIPLYRISSLNVSETKAAVLKVS